MRTAPDFMRSPNYDIEKGVMKDTATDAEKKAYEEYWNGEGQPNTLEDDYPEFKSPYTLWNGEVVDQYNPYQIDE